jgi:predicted transcriptional regulator
VAQAEKVNAAQSEDLKDDLQTAASLESTIKDYERDLQAELQPRLAEVEIILHRLVQRGLDFFDTTMRLTNIQQLMRGDKVRQEFESQVLADIPQQIEEHVQRLIDWLVQKDLQEWQRVMTYVQRRRALHTEQIVGEGLEPREMRRRELIDTMGRTVQQVIESYDREKEARELAAHVETAVAQTALLEVGAVGLGALVTAAVLSSSLDVTGILAAGTLAIVGFFVIPYKRKQAKDKFREKMTDLRENLLATLTTQFTKEAQRAVERLKEGITPYTRYVRSENERIDRTDAVLAGLRQRLSALRAQSRAVIGKDR